MKNSERILTIDSAMIRRALDCGKTVEIDGLGSFRPTADGGYEFMAQTEPRVFIAYVEEDLPLARRLRDRMAAAGCSPWMDKDKLIPGQDWPRTIRRAIEISDVFVACFSARSSSKRGPFQSELRWALALRAADAAGRELRGPGPVRGVRRAQADRGTASVCGSVSGLGRRDQEVSRAVQSRARRRKAGAA